MYTTFGCRNMRILARAQDGTYLEGYLVRCEWQLVSTEGELFLNYSKSILESKYPMKVTRLTIRIYLETILSFSKLHINQMLQPVTY